MQPLQGTVGISKFVKTVRYTLVQKPFQKNACLAFHIICIFHELSEAVKSVFFSCVRNLASLAACPRQLTNTKMALSNDPGYSTNTNLSSLEEPQTCLSLTKFTADNLIQLLGSISQHTFRKFPIWKTEQS